MKNFFCCTENKSILKHKCEIDNLVKVLLMLCLLYYGYVLNIKDIFILRDMLKCNLIPICKSIMIHITE